jgi:glycosyltransferase involved in cell wall biosynthesis
MKILIVMDPGISIPVKGYGGHERLVEMFAKEYLSLGHEVHLLITDGSHVAGCVVHGLGKEGFPPPKRDRNKTLFTAWKFLWKHRDDFDLIHNFGRLFYLLPVLNNSVKKIMTYGRIINSRNIKYISKLPFKNLVFTASSDWCVSTGNVAGKWKTVFNAIEFNKYTLKTDVSVEAPLIFLSRIERLKGAHEAINIAKNTNNKLIIAGNISPLKEEQEYFKNEIEPFIDGEQIVFVGTLDDAGKNNYLGKAKAMLFPARTEEAFGMVMVESMACGTPVIAYNHSAMPEVVIDGVTGFIVNDENEMVLALNKISTIKREEVRIESEKSFDVKIVAKKYLGLFNA